MPTTCPICNTELVAGYLCPKCKRDVEAEFLRAQIVILEEANAGWRKLYDKKCKEVKKLSNRLDELEFDKPIH